MKKKILYSAITLLIIVFTASDLKAQPKAYSGLMSVTGAYSIVSIKDTDELLNGGGFQLGYETLNGKKNLAWGFALGYLVGIAEEEEQQARYGTAPLWFYGKYLMGPEMLKFFVSGGIGYQISERRYSGSIAVPASSISSWDGGISFGLGAGINYYFNEKICGIISYNAQFYNNYFYKNGMAHVFNFGVGFQF